jgi:hypothetical protein
VKLIPYQNTGQISRTNQSDHLISVPKQFQNILEQKKNNQASIPQDTQVCISARLADKPWLKVLLVDLF